MPEQELSDVFERAVGDAAPDLGLLVAGATARGGALRLRRRAALTGAVAAVAGLAVAGGLLLRPGTPATAVPPATGDRGTPQAPAPTAQTTLPPDRVPLTGSAAMITLHELLGPRLVVDGWDGDGSPSNTTVRTTVTVRLHDRDTGETGTLEVQVVSPGPQQQPSGGFACDRRPVAEKCEPIGSTGGAHGTVSTRRDGEAQISHLSELLRADGVQIVMRATGVEGKEPVVTRSQLSKWVFDPDWQPVIDRRTAEDAALRMQSDPALNPLPRSDVRPSSLPSSLPSTTPSATPSSP
ncbi:hypothetical protein ACFV1L_32985 [Kitasatospora sp. NPDC059646]|uniref:hypothetical protein n=1 Tax=Kitasatospora sp. NPDC059646 TaxID=3346893 RepID=UPI003674354D